MKKIITLLLAFCMLLPLTACNKKEEEEADNGGSQEIAVTEDFEKVYLENLPERNYGGEEFYVLCTTQTEDFFNVEETGSDNILQSVFERNQAVEDKYNVDFFYDALNGNRNGAADFSARVSNSVMAGNDSYDLIVAQNYYVLPLASQGVLKDLKDSEYLHWDMPWYHQEINNNGVINDNLYGASGSYIMSQISYAMGVFFNKQMYNDQQFEEGDLYELVRNKKWTYEVLYNMAANFYDDVDGQDGITDNDLYGYVYNVHGVEASIVGSDCPIVQYDANGTPSIDGYYNEHLIEVFEDYNQFFNYSKGVHRDGRDDGPTIALGGGKALFANAQLGMMVDCAELRGSTYNYGIVPVPMYDEEQENYLTYTMRWELFYIPTTADLEKSSIILEYLNYTSEKIVVPAYWDVALNSRQADSPEDSEMLYLIRDCLYYDFAAFYGVEMGGIYRDPHGNGGVPSLIDYGKDANGKELHGMALDSWWNTYKSTFKTSLEQLLAKYSQ